MPGTKPCPWSIAILALACAAVAACDKSPNTGLGHPIPPPPEDSSFRYPNAQRIVAIGDLHGDLTATRSAFRLAGALSDDDHWAGGSLVVVQTGDQLDRGDDEPQILDLLERLAEEAHASGGALHTLNGNHELMNVQGDFRYVTQDGFLDYSQTARDGLHEQQIDALPPEQQGRAAAFLSGEIEAKRLARRPLVIQVGESLFVHGGLLEQHVDYGLARINREAKDWMSSPTSLPPPILDGGLSPVWLRVYSDGAPSPEACAELGRVLEREHAKRLVVGHTVQQEGINSACEGQVWRIDVGLSRSYGNPPAALEIRGESTSVLTMPPSPEPVASAPASLARPQVPSKRRSLRAPRASGAEHGARLQK